MYTKEYEQTHPLRFDHVIFDLDSLLVTIEGIDELAEINNVAHVIKPLTTKAMNGELSFEEVFEQRLDLINPTQQQLQSLGKTYIDHLTPGAARLVREVQMRHGHAYIISGGYNPAVSEVASHLGIAAENVFANTLNFDIDGNYLGINKTNPAVPLWTNTGKEIVIQTLMKHRPGKFALLSDSDLQAGKLVDRYICFAGVAFRPLVVEQATFVVTSNNLYYALNYLE